MGDVHIPQPKPNKVGAKVQELIDSGHQLYATAMTGRPSGRVRRPTLFIMAFAALVVELVFPPAAVVAIIAIGLLALTDEVVEL